MSCGDGAWEGGRKVQVACPAPRGWAGGEDCKADLRAERAPGLGQSAVCVGGGGGGAGRGHQVIPSFPVLARTGVVQAETCGEHFAERVCSSGRRLS